MCLRLEVILWEASLAALLCLEKGEVGVDWLEMENVEVSSPAEKYRFILKLPFVPCFCQRFSGS